MDHVHCIMFGDQDQLASVGADGRVIVYGQFQLEIFGDHFNNTLDPALGYRTKGFSTRIYSFDGVDFKRFVWLFICFVL